MQPTNDLLNCPWDGGEEKDRVQLQLQLVRLQLFLYLFVHLQLQLHRRKLILNSIAADRLATDTAVHREGTLCTGCHDLPGGRVGVLMGRGDLADPANPAANLRRSRSPFLQESLRHQAWMPPREAHASNWPQVMTWQRRT